MRVRCVLPVAVVASVSFLMQSIPWQGVRGCTIGRPKYSRLSSEGSSSTPDVSVIAASAGVQRRSRLEDEVLLFPMEFGGPVKLTRKLLLLTMRIAAALNSNRVAQEFAVHPRVQPHLARLVALWMLGEDYNEVPVTSG